MDNGRLRLTFRFSETGLQSGATDGEKLGGFELAGEDGVFVSAQAAIEGGNVTVWRDGVEARVVRYAWAPNPFPAANLHNRVGLPASPFSLKVE